MIYIQYLIFSANLVTWLTFWTETFFKKHYTLLIMPLFIGEKCVSDATEFKLLCLLRPVLMNVFVSFHEIYGDPLEKTGSNRQVCYCKQTYSRALKNICYKKQTLRGTLAKRCTAKRCSPSQFCTLDQKLRKTSVKKLNFSKVQGF